MSDARAFFDTNILVYCFDQIEVRKQRIAHRLVLEQGVMERGVICYQVEQEFLSVAIQMLRAPEAVRRIHHGFQQLSGGFEIVPSSEKLFQDALVLWERHSIAWYDSLIIAAAKSAKCDVLYSEDMQHGLRLDNLRIVNPFL